MSRDSHPVFTYHLVSSQTWANSGQTEPYRHPSLADEGFIHCTDGALALAASANRYFSAESDTLMALEIDRRQISAEVRYDDTAQVFPHIYGPLNRDAIRRVLVMKRGADGAWLPPDLDKPGTGRLREP